MVEVEAYLALALSSFEELSLVADSDDLRVGDAKLELVRHGETCASQWA